MVTICRDWDPNDNVWVCNSFDADITTCIKVDRFGETMNYLNNGDPEDPHSCTDHGDNIEDVSNARGATIYENIAWDAGYGFCNNCWMATRETDDYDCADCGDQYWPYGEDPNENDEDDEEETTATQAAAFIRARQRRPTGRPVETWGDKPHPHTSRIHALSIPHDG